MSANKQRNQLHVRYLLVVIGLLFLYALMHAGAPKNNVEMTVRDAVPWFVLATLGGALVLVGMMSERKESIGPVLLGTLGGFALLLIWI